ncbi:MAG: hypothetical protein V1824_03450 [archaeon]
MNQIKYKNSLLNTKLEVLHYPNLKTVLEVEEIIRKSNTPLTRYKILKKINNKIMKQTLNVTLAYLSDKGLIYEGKKGILWTYSTNEQINKLLENGLEL